MVRKNSMQSDEPMAPEFAVACQHERKYIVSNNLDGNALNIIPPRFGSIPFDENYRKNELKFTTSGLSSNIIFKGAAQHGKARVFSICAYSIVSVESV